MQEGVQLLMVVANRQRPPTLSWVRVAKVGRKWAALVSADDAEYSRGRCEIDTLAYDTGGFHSNVTLFTSREEYEETTLLHKLWREVQDQTRNQWKRPEHLTIENLRAILTLLSPPSTKE